MEFRTESAEETVKIGVKIGKLLKVGDVVALIGDLGAGKTHLVKGVAEGLGVPSARQTVTSPTFSLINEYLGRVKIFHLDWYRLDKIDGPDLELANECFDSAAVTLVEWANRGVDVLPEERIVIKMKNVDISSRFIEVFALGKKYDFFMSALLGKAVK